MQQRKRQPVSAQVKKGLARALTKFDAYQLAKYDRDSAVKLRDVLRQHFQRMSDNQDLLLGYVRGAIAMSADPEAWHALERHRMGIVAWTCEVAGLNPENDALQLTLRTAGDAMDQLSVRWLQQGRNFDIDALVDWSAAPSNLARS